MPKVEKSAREWRHIGHNTGVMHVGAWIHPIVPKVVKIRYAGIGSDLGDCVDSSTAGRETLLY